MEIGEYRVLASSGPEEFMAKKGNDISLLLGLGIGLGGILIGYILEGGKPAALIGVSALIIV